MKIRTLGLCAGLLSVLLITGCGGGGGDGGTGGGVTPGDSGGSSNFSLAFSPAALDIEREVVSAYTEDVMVDIAYVGDIPSRSVFVFVQHDTSFSGVDPYVGETEAQLFLTLANSLAVGEHSGVITVDVCYDQNCSEMAAPRATLPYTINVVRSQPAFFMKRTQEASYEPVNEIKIREILGADPAPIYIKVEPPSQFPTMTLPQDLVDEYSLEFLGDYEFVLHPTFQHIDTYEHYNIDFSNDTEVHATRISVDISRDYQSNENGFAFTQKLIPLSLSHSNYSFYATNYFKVSQEGNDTSVSVEYSQGDGWLKPPYYDTSEIQVELDPQNVPTDFSHARVTATSATEGAISFDVYYLPNHTTWQIYGNANALHAGTTVEQMSEIGFIQGTLDVPVQAESLTPWLVNISKSISDMGDQWFSFGVDIDKFNEAPIDVTHGQETAYVKVYAEEDSNQVDIIEIALDISIACVYRIEPSVVSAGQPFELVAYEAAFSASPTNVYVKGAGETGLGHLYELNDMVSNDVDHSNTFTMPALDTGSYHLNFAGLFGPQCNDITLTVE